MEYHPWRLPPGDAVNECISHLPLRHPLPKALENNGYPLFQILNVRKLTGEGGGLGQHLKNSNLCTMCRAHLQLNTTKVLDFKNMGANYQLSKTSV